MIRIVCLAIGYCFGMFQTAFIYGKMHGIEIREKGSGNAGTTNALRVLGKKAGLIVFLGDALKAVFAMVLVHFLFEGSHPEMAALLRIYAGAGVVLGHNFPFYMGFKGGKGIAASAGLLAAMDWRVMLICLIVFVAVVAVTRYVSLGSILVMILFSTGMIYFAGRGDFGIHEAAFPEFCLMAVVIALMGIWRHRTNIRRLLSGTENKLGAKKQ